LAERRRRQPEPPSMPYTTALPIAAEEQQRSSQRKFRDTLDARAYYPKVAQQNDTGVNARQDEHPSSLVVKEELSHIFVPPRVLVDRKSTRLNSSHEWISYAVFCLK